MNKPSELLRVKFENNLLRTELIVRQLQEQLDKERAALQSERKILIEMMRKEVDAPSDWLYNNESQSFVPRKE